MGASSDAVKLGYGVETSYGVLPGTVNLQLVRFTSESLATTPTTQAVDEIVGGATAVAAVTNEAVRTSIASGGDINGLLSYKNWDDFFDGLAYTTPTTPAANVTGVEAQATGNKLVAAGIDSGIVVGQWIKSSNFSNAANNGIFKVTAKASGEITVAGSTLVNESAPGIVEESERFLPGIAAKSYYIQRYNSDLTTGSEFSLYKGCVPTAFNLSMRDKGPLTARWTFFSQEETLSSTTAVTGSETAAPTNPVMGGLNVNAVLIGDGTAYNIPVSCIRTFDMTISNGARPKTCANEVSPQGLSRGRMSIEGSLSFLFEGTVTQMSAWLAGTTSAVAITIEDSAGNGYAFEAPEIRPGEVTHGTPGKGQDVDVTLGWVGFKEPGANGHLFKIERFGS